MFKNDTVRPYRTPNAVQSMWQRVLHSERGEVDTETPPETPPAPPADNWRDTLPDNLKAHPIFEKYNSPHEALAAFVDVQKLIGPEKIIMPGKDADEKEWNERVFDRLGRPKESKDYQLPTDLQIPKELPVSERLIEGFRGIAHKTGMLPKQFQEAYKWFMNEQIANYNDGITANKKSSDEARTALRTEWGAAFDQNLALGEKVLQSYGDENIINLVRQNGLHTNPDFVKFLHKIGSVLSEDQLSGKPPSLTLAPEEAKAELAKMENDPKHPLFDATHPEHDSAMKKRDMLYRQIYRS